MHCEDCGLVLLQCWCEDCGLLLLQCCCEDFVGCSCCSAFVFQDSRLLLLQCCFQDYVWVHQTPDDCNLFAVRKREKETGTTRERNQQGTHIDSQEFKSEEESSKQAKAISMSEGLQFLVSAAE